MSRRRRAIALATLSLLLGALALSDVAAREAALGRRIGPTVGVLLSRVDLPAGARLPRRALAVRRVPLRFAPTAAFSRPAEVGSLRTTVAVPAGTDLTAPLVRDPALAAADAQAAADGARSGRGTLRPGERVAEIVARGDARLLGPGSRVDLLVTREAADGSGTTTLALEDAEVLAASPATGEGEGGGADRGSAPGPRVALSLRVTLREAVALAEAQNFAKELRVLARVDGDRRRGAKGLTVGERAR